MNRKIYRLTLNGAIALMFVGTFPQVAQASTLPLNSNPLSQFLSQITSNVNDWLGNFEKMADLKLGPFTLALGSDIKPIVEQTRGVLGLPDPVEARQRIEQNADPTNTAVNQVEYATNETDRQIVAAVAQSTLGGQGQQRIQTELQMTQQSAAQVQQISEACQGEVITQNVMKCQLVQNSQLASLVAAQQPVLRDLQKSQELGNLNLNNISRTLDGQAHAEQSQRVNAGLRNYQLGQRARLF